MPSSVSPTVTATKSKKDLVEKRILELAKQMKEDVTPAEVAEIKEAFLAAALQGLTTKTIADFKLSQHLKKAEHYKKLATGTA